MKVERKKAREELDSVNAIEWRTADSRKRFFLLVRRPEGGQYPIPPTISRVLFRARTYARRSENRLTDIVGT